MGSGLILLVIVGAWLAVLVPMALRSHDSAASLTSVDRFSDAMRVLSRRDGEERGYAGARAVVMPKRPAPPATPLYDDVVPLTAAERRRRTLAGLVGTALLSLGLALLGVPGTSWLHVLCDVLLVAFVVHLRRQAVLRAERRAREQSQAPRQRRPLPVEEELPARTRTVQVPGIPDRMPARPAPLAPVSAPAARYEDAPLPVAAGAEGVVWASSDSSWDPVPVPPPTYVGKPAAPARQPRVLDLTKPGEWSATLGSTAVEMSDDTEELEVILDRRRAVNDW